MNLRPQPAPVTTLNRLRTLSALIVLSTLLAACSTPLEQANELSRAGRYDDALALLSQAAATDPRDERLRVRLLRERAARAQQLVLQAEAARSAGRPDDARRLLAAATALDTQHPRLNSLRAEVDRAEARVAKVEAARSALKDANATRAAALIAEVLTEDPGHPAAAQMRRQLAELQPRAPAAQVLAPAFRQPISLEFRDAPLRSVFESLSRGSGISFIFDREVRGDAKVTLLLRDTTLDEALRIMLSTQGLERKLLNETTMLVFPNTAAKLREHQDLATRAFYLSNVDVRQAQAMVRTLAKVRDVHIDERLNLLLVRDTAEVLQLVERLLATVDLPDPEVMLDVQVMEVASDKLDSLGLQWPDTAAYGLPGADGGAGPATAPLSARGLFRGWLANPALVATLRGNTGAATLIANPTIRVRNREKAKIHVGDKLPVFTTTATANVGVSASVSFLDVGLKLEIEPTVQLGNEVSMRVALEVSNLLKEVSGPSGALAYQVGTRLASTVLRLADGETQVLAGLINDEDRRRAVGVPGLSTMPVLGALFGVQSDSRNKTEVVLLITPRVVRNVAMPTHDGLLFDAGTDANPGAIPLRLSAAARSAVGLAQGGGTAALVPMPAAAMPANTEALVLASTASAAVGETVAVTLRNESPHVAKGTLQYDAQFLQPASDGGAGAGNLPFELKPREEKVLMLRVLPAARGQSLNLTVSDLAAKRADGNSMMLSVSGAAMIDIAAQ